MFDVECSMFFHFFKFHRGQVLDVCGLAFAVERHNERQATDTSAAATVMMRRPGIWPFGCW